MPYLLSVSKQIPSPGRLYFALLCGVARHLTMSSYFSSLLTSIVCQLYLIIKPYRCYWSMLLSPKCHPSQSQGGHSCSAQKNVSNQRTGCSNFITRAISLLLIALHWSLSVCGGCHKHSTTQRGHCTRTN